MLIMFSTVILSWGTSTYLTYGKSIECSIVLLSSQFTGLFIGKTNDWTSTWSRTTYV